MEHAFVLHSNPVHTGYHIVQALYSQGSMEVEILDLGHFITRFIEDLHDHYKTLYLQSFGLILFLISGLITQVVGTILMLILRRTAPKTKIQHTLCIISKWPNFFGKTSILKQIVWETKKLHYNVRTPSGSWVIDQKSILHPISPQERLHLLNL